MYACMYVYINSLFHENMQKFRFNLKEYKLPEIIDHINNYFNNNKEFYNKKKKRSYFKSSDILDQIINKTGMSEMEAIHFEQFLLNSVYIKPIICTETAFSKNNTLYTIPNPNSPRAHVGNTVKQIKLHSEEIDGKTCNIVKICY